MLSRAPSPKRPRGHEHVVRCSTSRSRPLRLGAAYSLSCVAGAANVIAVEDAARGDRDGASWRRFSMVVIRALPIDKERD